MTTKVAAGPATDDARGADHEALDQAVTAAYGWERPLDDDEILGRLLALNLERAG